MSYEVYINIVHHPRHLDDFEHELSDASRWVEPEDATPTEAERLRCVVNALRAMADDYDPDVVCVRCGKLAHTHHGYPKRPYLCFNRYGPRMTTGQEETKAP